jgi:acyl carrier protein
VNDDQARELTRSLLHTIAPEADLDRLDADEPLRDALDLDSIDFLNFVAAIHEQTGVDIPERDYPAVSTLAGCAAYLAGAGSGAGAAGRR